MDIPQHQLNTQAAQLGQVQGTRNLSLARRHTSITSKQHSRPLQELAGPKGELPNDTASANALFKTSAAICNASKVTG
eukprot:1158959-Pelagomonas_calceolata.AAC.12